MATREGPRPGCPRQRWRVAAARSRPAAAAVVGVHELRFLGYPDGRVESTLDLRRDISRVIREVRPQRVLGQSPDRNWDRVYASHPDHLAVGEATIAAVYPDARNRWAHPELEREGLEPWAVAQTWIGAGAAGVTHYIDITTSIDRKIEALLCHKSQLPDPVATGEMVRGWTAMIAAGGGLPEGRFAESVRVVITG